MHYLIRPLAALVSFLVVPAMAMAQTGDMSRYVRVADAAEGDHLKLEVAVRTLERAGGPTVHLVGVVHIGDQAYYDALQQFLDAQGLVLFEGVKPAGGGEALEGDEQSRAKKTLSRQRLLAVIVTRHTKEMGSFPATLAEALAPLRGSIGRLGNAATNDGWGRSQTYTLTDTGFDIVSLGADGEAGGEGAAADIAFSGQKALTKAELAGAGDGIQVKLARALGLEFQLAAVHYDSPSWRNSDMSIDELQQKLAESGASGEALLAMLDGSSMSAKLAGLILGFVERSREMSMMAKIMMVETLAHADRMMEAQAAMGPLMKVIVEDRNTAVLADLDAVMKDEPGVKSVALFYGAGHLPDLETRLTRDRGYAFASDTWFTAIDIDLATVPGAKAQAVQTRKMMKAMIEKQTKAPAVKP